MYVAELAGVAFGLEGDVSVGEGGAVVVAEVVVCHDDFAVDDVLNGSVVDDDFGGDPFAKGGGDFLAFGDVFFDGFAVEVEVGAGGADGAGDAFAGFILAEKLKFEGGGVGLVDAHLLGAFSVKHGAAVGVGPDGGAGGLFAVEAVFAFEVVVGEGLVVDQVAEVLFEGGGTEVLVGDGDGAVDYAEDVVGVFAGGVAVEFGGPSVEVLLVEEGDPGVVVAAVVVLRAADGGHHYEG